MASTAFPFTYLFHPTETETEWTIVGDENFITTIENGSTVVSERSHPELGFEVTREVISNGSTHYPGYRLELDVSLQIALYAGIFLLAVIGNSLVILTLVQNQGMRTITNLFLLNLAISDLLVGVLCMPFSLVGVILKDFLFGAILCKLIPYLQAVSVSVSAWTLVAISVERYYAICHPLTSRRWQTLSHAYKMIGVVWILSGLSMAPIAIVNTLQPIRDTGRHKCRENWSNWRIERAYTIFLDVILLILPLVIMTVKYSLITRVLFWNVAERGDGSTRTKIAERSSMLEASDRVELTNTSSATPSPKTPTVHNKQNGRPPVRNSATKNSSFRRSSSTTCQISSPLEDDLEQLKLQRVNTDKNYHRPALLRRCNVTKSLKRKKRVIQMLGVVVTEFFVCWTPLYIMNTWYLFNPSEVYGMIGPLGVSLIQLVAYLSSCVNPITYCFMNRGFRMAFCSVFGCPSYGHSTFQSIPAKSRLATTIRLSRRKGQYFHAELQEKRGIGTN